MLSLIDRVRRAIRLHGLIPPGSRVVVGLSGGPDSVALTVLLAELSTDGGFEVARLAHLHHGLRGSAADEDETFCRTLAASLALPIDVERVDVRALAREGRWSIEEAGREARYRFFNHVADLADANRIAVGHTLEDQAETFLLNLLRGAGSRGLAGMHPMTGRVIRPLLDTRHAELRQFLAERGLTFREDETNEDTSLLRNRVRHLVIPYLEQQVSPGVTAVLARDAAISRDDAAWIEAEAVRAWDRTARSSVDGIELDCAALSAEPPALARRIALHALEAASAGRFVGFDHAEALLAMVRGEVTGAADFPGVRAERAGALVTLRPRSGRGRGTADRATDYCYVLSIPGEAHVPEAGATVTAELAHVNGVAGLDSILAGWRGRVAVVDSSTLGCQCRVRSRQPGDRFQPLGLAGTKKLQDFFVDRKVPENERDTIPLVVDGNDRIVWVAGHAICEDFRVTAQTGAVVILRLESWGDRA
jgi:tRNA(Ile)-lysidine synthase